VASRPYGLKTDVWSLGIVLCQLCTDRNPYYDHDKNETKNRIVESPIEFELDLWEASA
jgi:serine/threonine protein kinase